MSVVTETAAHMAVQRRVCLRRHFILFYKQRREAFHCALLYRGVLAVPPSRFQALLLVKVHFVVTLVKKNEFSQIRHEKLIFSASQNMTVPIRVR